ncbi:MAG: DUF86 domain-containing protein [Anaerolineae bacterium]|nr:DUF86 domain-containing protein [Anaerolineae bacterium]
MQNFITNKTRLDLEKDDFLLGFAVVRALEIIGEAANKVTTETRALLPELPWHEIIGMRNRIIHAYDRVNYDVVWDTAVMSVPYLIQLLEGFLPPETDASEAE